MAPSWPRSLRKVPGAQCWASSPSPRGLVFLVVPCEQAAGWGQVAPPHAHPGASAHSWALPPAGEHTVGAS